MNPKLYRSPVTKLLAVLTALVMLCSGALAETIDTWEPEPDIQEYETINSIALAIAFSNGKAQCEVNVSLRGDKQGSAAMTFYRKNGSSWVSIRSWTVTSTSGGTIASSKSFSAVAGNTYKLVVVVTTSEETKSANKTATY